MSGFTVRARRSTAAAALWAGVLGFGLLTIGLVAGTAWAQEREPRRVVVGVNDNYPPLESLAPDGTPVGFDVDLVTAAAAAAGIEIELRSGRWSALRAAFAAGEIDVLAGMIRTRLRDETVDFSAPYLAVDYVTVTRSERDPPESERDLAGLSIVVEESSAAHEWAAEHGLSERLVLRPSEPDAVRAVLEGAGDVAIVARRTAHAHARDGQGVARIAAESLFHGFLCIAAPEGARDLVDSFDAGLDAVHRSGAYKEIYDRWLAPERDRVLGLPVDVVRWIVALVALLTLALVGWSTARQRGLRRERDAAEQRFLQMFERSPIPSAVLTAEGALATVNPAFARLVDRPADQLVGGCIDLFVHPDDLAAETERVRGLFDGTASAYGADLRFVRPDGSVRWCRLSAILLASRRGLARALGMLEDVTERHDEEARLREREALYRSTIEDQTEFLVRWKPDGTRVLVNDSYCRYFGIPRDRVVGTSFFPHILDEDLDAVRGRLARLTPDAPVSTGEHRVTRSDGSVRWQQWTDRGLFAADGTLLELLSVGQDVTERREAEEARERSERQYRSLIENAHDLITVVDQAARVVYQSPAAERILGRRPEARVGGSMFDLLHEDDRPSVAALLERGFRTPGETVSFTHRLRHADGSWRLMESVGRAFVGAEGELRGIVNSRDVTDRERVAEQLKWAEARFRLAIEAGLDAFVMLLAVRDDAGEIVDFVFTDVNERWCALLRRERADFIGSHLSSVMPTAVDYGFVEHCRGVALTGEPFVEEFQVRAESVAASWLRYQIVRVGDGVAVTTRDISDVHDAAAAHGALEEQLRHAQKMEAIGVLAGGVAHDFNNLLTVIGGYVTILQTEPGASRRERAMVAIADAHSRAVNLTRQLLTFGRRQVTQAQPLRIGWHVVGLHGMLERLVGENVDVSVDVAPDEWFVSADSAQIDQVVVNLAANSRDSMPGGGHIRITTRNVTVTERRGEGAEAIDPGDYVELAFTDDGEGMDDDVRLRVFEPFFTTKAERGTGLGLASVYGIVTTARGRIEVESTPGKGSTFRIVLPRTAPPSPDDADTEPLPEAPDEPAVGRVLVVDDEDAVRDLLAEVLRDDGYDVETAPDGATAIEIAGRGPRFDVLVTDLVMPGIGGRELGRRLRAAQPDLVVLHVSGYAKDALTDPPAAHELLTKPFSLETLCDRIRRLLADRG